MSNAKHWCYTLNNYTEEDVARLSTLPDRASYHIFASEVGASGTPHLQGFISFKKQTKLGPAKKIIGNAHLSVARNIESAIAYCKKDGDWQDFGEPPQPKKKQGSRSDLESFKEAVKGGMLDFEELREHHSVTMARYPRFVSDYIRDHTPTPPVTSHPLRDWQQDLNARLKLSPNDREILFVVDPNGNSGKTWFCKYFCSLHSHVQIMEPGPKKDMAHALNPTVKYLFMDAPRSKQGEFIQYDFLEKVKDGMVFSPKYESGMKYLGPVHVVVFMNEQPDMTKLSQDRYTIIYT